MKKIIFVLASIFLVGLLVCTNQVPGVVNGVENDNDVYGAVESYVDGFGYHVDKSSIQTKVSENGTALLTPIISGNGEVCGMISKQNGLWRFAVNSDSGLSAYRVVEGQSKNIEIAKEHINFSEEVAVSKEEILKSRGLSKTSASYGVCKYVSKAGFNLSCWSDENFLAYYYVLVTKVGDPITAFHYQWCMDWQRRTISCPLNEVTSSMTYCGVPPRR